MRTRICIFLTLLLFLIPESPSFGYQVSLLPSLNVSEEYTDNLFNSNENKEDDFITIISPSINVQVLSRTRGLEMSYSPAYSIYNRFSDYNGFRHNAYISAWDDISRKTRLEFENFFFRTEDPLPTEEIYYPGTEEVLLQGDATVRQSRQPYFTNTTFLQLTHNYGVDESVYLAYRYRILENDDDSSSLASQNDNSEHNPFAGFNYWMTPFWGLSGNFSYTAGLFTNSENINEYEGIGRLIRRFSRRLDSFFQYDHVYVTHDGPGDDYQVMTPSLGFDYDVAEDISLTMSGGVSFVNYEEGDDDTSFSFYALLSKKFRRGSIDFSGSGGYQGAYFGSENLGLSNYYEGAVAATYVFTRYLSGDINGAYRYYDYQQQEGRKDKTSRVGFGVTWEPLRWMSFRTEYYYRQVDSTQDVYSYEENRVLLRVALFPVLPYRFAR